jgi:hypothetical protein
MTSSISSGRRWASAIATAALVTALGLPAIALGAPPPHANENATDGSNGVGCGNLGGETSQPGNPNRENRGNDNGLGNTDCDGDQEDVTETGPDEQPDPDEVDDDEVNDDEVNNDDVNNDDVNNDDVNNDDEVNNDDVNNDVNNDEVNDDENLGDPEESEQSPGESELPVGGDFCEQPLVVFTLDGQEGHPRAVRIVAQAIESGSSGWEFIEWRASRSTRISAVQVTRGEVVTVQTGDDLRGGFEQDVDRIAFCGETSDRDRDDEDRDRRDRRDRDRGDANTGAPELTPPSTPPATPSPETQPGSGDAPAEAPQAAPEAEVRGVVLWQPAPAADTSASTGTNVAAASDTEVLGVTLARTGLDLGGLAAAGTLGLLAGGGVLAATRRRDQVGEVA